MQPAERDEYAFATVRIGQGIRSPRVRDVDLDDDEVWAIVGVNALDVLVDDDGLVIISQVRGESGEPEGRKQRVLDRAPERAGGLSQRWQNELHAKAARHREVLCITKTVRPRTPNDQRPNSQPRPTSNSQLNVVGNWELGVGSGWALVVGSWELI
jgi:hypothetical protein